MPRLNRSEMLIVIPEAAEYVKLESEYYIFAFYQSYISLLHKFCEIATKL